MHAKGLMHQVLFQLILQQTRRHFHQAIFSWIVNCKGSNQELALFRPLTLYVGYILADTTIDWALFWEGYKKLECCHTSQCLSQTMPPSHCHINMAHVFSFLVNLLLKQYHFIVPFFSRVNWKASFCGFWRYYPLNIVLQQLALLW